MSQKNSSTGLTRAPKNENRGERWDLIDVRADSEDSVDIVATREARLGERLAGASRERLVSAVPSLLSAGRGVDLSYRQSDYLNDGGVDVNKYNDTKSSESEVLEKKALVNSGLSLSIRGMLRNGRGKGKAVYLRAKTTMGVNLTANSVAAKYLLLIGANTVWDVNQIANCVEWGSFNTIFEEFFVHSMNLRFEPNNQFTTGYGTGTVNLEDCMLSLGAYQHNQPAPTDSTHVWADMQNSRISKVTNTGRPWTFNWKNIEKFAKDGPSGDATTATNSQSWLNILSVAKYGGYISGATPYPSNAAAGAGQFVNGYVFGNILVTWDVSFRYRD